MTQLRRAASCARRDDISGLRKEIIDYLAECGAKEPLPSRTKKEERGWNHSVTGRCLVPLRDRDEFDQNPIQ